jgi:hypothetical protein
MAAVLSALDELCRLTVLFCAQTGTRGLPWSGMRLPAGCRFVDGLTIRHPLRDGAEYYPSPRILAAIASSQPDAIVSNAFSFPSLYAAAYAIVKRTGLVVFSDGTARSESWQGHAQRFSRRLFARLPGTAAALSEAAAQRFVELGWSPERVFRPLHSTDIEPFHAVGRARTYAPARPLSLLYVGRLVPVKGVEHLIRAVSAARSQGVDLRIDIKPNCDAKLHSSAYPRHGTASSSSTPCRGCMLPRTRSPCRRCGMRLASCCWKRQPVGCRCWRRGRRARPSTSSTGHAAAHA